MIFIYTSHFKRMFLRLLHVFRYSNQHTSGISLNNWNSFLQRCMYMYIIYAWFLFSLLARIDSWHIPTPHQLNFHNDLAAIMYPSLPIFFLWGRGEFLVKKIGEGYIILQLQMTLSDLRVTGEDDVSSPKYRAVIQSSNRHSWLALILSSGYRMGCFRTRYCLTSLAYVYNCLFVLGVLS